MPIMNETSSQAASTAALLTSAVTDAAKAVINTTAEVLENAATGKQNGMDRKLFTVEF